MVQAPREVFVVGTSCVGKTTCAEALALRLGRPVIATDALARHPGRPWLGAPEPVLTFYRALPADAIVWFLRVHHQNMRPIIADALAAARASGSLICEGAALRPEHFAGWDADPAAAVCLTAARPVLRDRILRASRYDTHPADIRAAIDAFVQRSTAENDALAEAAADAGIAVLDTSDLSARSVLSNAVALLGVG